MKMFLITAATAAAALSFSPLLTAAGASDLKKQRAEIAAHWTPARRNAAIPRDLLIDPRGLGYIK